MQAGSCERLLLGKTFSNVHTVHGTLILRFGKGKYYFVSERENSAMSVLSHTILGQCFHYSMNIPYRTLQQY